MVTEIAVDIPASTEPVARKRDYGSSARLWAGFLGRAWLWFLCGCLVVTFLPMLFGWRPYVVESGSMQPRINVGDVILSSPEHNAAKLLGHVTVFNDPAHPGTVKSHRVVAINPDGTMVTKGDANPTNDSVPVPMYDVKGIGRLLVRWIGLPLIWLQRGQWLYLALVIASIWLAAFFVVRDHDESVDSDVESDTDDADATTDDGDSRDDDWDDDAVPTPRHRADDETPLRPDLLLAVAVRDVRRSLRRAHHRRRATPAQLVRKVGARIAVVAVGAAALLVPTSQAAFSATTAADSNRWSVAAVTSTSYTDDVLALKPFLYWRLDESVAPKQTIAADQVSGGPTGLYSPAPRPKNSAWKMQQPGALPDDSLSYSVTSQAASTCIYTDAATGGVAAPGPAQYSEIIWFNAPSGYNAGGKLIGLESALSGVSDSTAGGQYDRMLYMDGAGEVWFGVWATATNTAVAIHSASGLNDGAWHMAVATMSAASGMALYIDGAEVASDPNTVSQTELAESYWRVGCGNLSGWVNDWTGPNAPSAQTNYSFQGGLDEATVFLTPLTSADVARLYFDR